jgi:hypothetical protein
MSIRFAALAATTLLLTPHAKADQVINDDLILTRDLCVGSVYCVDGEVFGNTDIKVKSSNPEVLFDDTGTTDDWVIATDDLLAPTTDAFVVRSVTGPAYPFGLHDDAPTGSLWVASSGRIGIGTTMPVVDLHILDTNGLASLRLEETSGTAQTFDIGVSNSAFRVEDITNGTLPITLQPGAPSHSLRIVSNGDIGLGTATPAGKLHTRGTGTQLAYFESSDGGAVQVRFRTNSENRRFLAVNNANEVKSQIVFGDNQIQFLGENISQEWLRISSAGIVSSGPTCNPNPCDATFDPEAFTVPPIAERAAYMWENMHLPAVGPTAPGEPFNLTEKTAGMLHELEVAHIYIEQLHDEQDTLRSQVAELTVLSAAQQVLKNELLARLKSLEEK